jgi:dGTPase
VTGGYDEHATERFAAEPVKRAHSPWRSPFQRDRARVLHSAALRRLAAKTQVVAVGSADFLRTRLTHSLECAQIGRELGAELGCDPDLVDAACLAHDLGHPPFGHNGESALDQIAADCGGFEGNAQSLRLLTRLEAKVPGAGLNLTRATLDATLKYPWLTAGRAAADPAAAQPWASVSRAAALRAAQRSGSVRGAAELGAAEPGTAEHMAAVTGYHRAHDAAAQPGAEPRGPEPGVVEHKAVVAGKYGAYDEDAEVFRWIRDGAPPGRACLEAQVMDWADDVAYSVHDLEDGLHTGLITFGKLRDPAERQRVAELTLAEYLEPGSAAVDELCDVFGRLLELSAWPWRFDGGPETTAAVKNLTSELIGRFCDAARQATMADRHVACTRYAAELTVPRRQRLECALLKGVTAHYVMGRHGAAQAQAREREVLTELAAALTAGAPEVLDPMFRPAYESAGSQRARRRVIVDQIASLTDTSALAWHTRLCR